MKKCWACVPMLALLICCQNPKTKLTESQAWQLIAAENKYPLQLQESIYINDPEYVRRLSDSGLVSRGYVVLNKVTLGDLNTPLISLTDSGKRYQTVNADPKTVAVKIGVEDITEVSFGSGSGVGDTVHAMYTTAIKDTTPFIKLFDPNKLKGASDGRTVRFVTQNGKWVILK